MHCLFCSIIQGEVPSQIIFENDVAFSFLDVHPIAPGHAMVIPKNHVPTILELSHEHIGGFFQAVQHVTAMLKKTFSPHGFTIGINHGRVSGQTVEHLHVHIIPRFNDDGGHSLHSVVHNPPHEDLALIAQRIREQNA